MLFINHDSVYRWKQNQLFSNYILMLFIHGDSYARYRNVKHIKYKFSLTLSIILVLVFRLSNSFVIKKKIMSNSQMLNLCCKVSLDLWSTSSENDCTKKLLHFGFNFVLIVGRKKTVQCTWSFYQIEKKTTVVYLTGHVFIDECRAKNYLFDTSRLKAKDINTRKLVKLRITSLTLKDSKT